mgnify:CR=1 FL=1
MNKLEMAEIEFGTGRNCLTAWVGGKYLGVVHTDGEGVHILLHQRVLRTSRRRSWSLPALDDAVEKRQGGSGSLSGDSTTDL